MRLRIGIALVCLLAVLGWQSDEAQAQSFGVEVNNTLMPASGGMAGASIARPQDLTSAINGNPASVTQFHGTQFLFGGSWAEPTFNLQQTAPIPTTGTPLIEPYAAKSSGPGAPGGNIGVTQDFSAMGLPGVVGIGFVSTAGGFTDFRQVPQSDGTNSDLVVFNAPIVAGIDLTDRLSIGAGMSLGIAFYDGPFVAVSGMTPDYGLRGMVGANYDLTDNTTLGLYYQTKQHYRFDNAVRFNFIEGEPAFNVNMDLPQNVGFGFANTSLADGKLLIAVDILYKMWADADLFSAVYKNQWVAQIGTQYSMGKYRLRAGYAWAENPIDPNPSANLGGIVQPGGTPILRYSQALMAVTSQHRISGGIGVVDVMPGVDLDMMAGGMFRDHEQFGPFTNTSIESYWVGFGLTWRFNRGSCQRLPAPDNWGPTCAQ